MPFEGRRYTLIYWSHSSANMLQPADRAFLVSLHPASIIPSGGDLCAPLSNLFYNLCRWLQVDVGFLLPDDGGGESQNRVRYPSRATRMATGEAALAAWERQHNNA